MTDQTSLNRNNCYTCRRGASSIVPCIARMDWSLSIPKGPPSSVPLIVANLVQTMAKKEALKSHLPVPRATPSVPKIQEENEDPVAVLVCFSRCDQAWLPLAQRVGEKRVHLRRLLLVAVGLCAFVNPVSSMRCDYVVGLTL